MLEETFQSLLDISEKYSDLTFTNDNPDESCIWKNYKFSPNNIRYGHLEYFKSSNDKVEVVHAMCYPSTNIEFPIFGFDVIALNGNVTGVFCDVTPVPYDNFEMRVIFQILHEKYNEFNRSLPEWANFFSANFLALAPKDNFKDITLDCVNAFDKFLYFIKRANIITDNKKIEYHRESQNKYSLHQQKNTKTFKALSSYVGEEKAKNFIETVLFPTLN